MIDLEMKRKSIPKFIETAVSCRCQLAEKIVPPCAIADIVRSEKGKVEALHIAPAEQAKEIPLGKGQSLCLDFGNHYVGYVTLELKSVGSPQDSPGFLRLKFGETAKEISVDSEDYDGWISKGWIQEEFLHVDVLPAVIRLPRRYAFRYMELYVIDTSKKWKVVLEKAVLKAVSAVSMKEAEPVNGKEVLQKTKQNIASGKKYRNEMFSSGLSLSEEEMEKMIEKIDNVSLCTLMNCMQDVFEDGPKRDRRLWLGDLRLQALTNYVTFRNYDLVKRCLYLFAGLTREDGRVGACVFTEPEYIVDDTFFFDYSLFFISVLHDYYKASGDMQTLKELWECAYAQIEILKKEFDEQHLIRLTGSNGCFIDWKDGLDKQAAAQGVYIYCVKQALELSEALKLPEVSEKLKLEIEAKEKAARTLLWDEKEGLFVSGPNHQRSVASQVWMILAGVIGEEEGKELLNRISSGETEALGMATPYMSHCYAEALLLCGEKKLALDYILYYWGGMIREGADTFWELFDPQNPEMSPYGSDMVNSYCHAWSCTPAYLFRKYFLNRF